MTVGLWKKRQPTVQEQELKLADRLEDLIGEIEAHLEALEEEDPPNGK